MLQREVNKKCAFDEPAYLQKQLTTAQTALEDQQIEQVTVENLISFKSTDQKDVLKIKKGARVQIGS